MLTKAHRLLLIANRTCPCPGVLAAVGDRLAPGGEVLIVAPALNSRVRHWFSDVDAAAVAARGRRYTASRRVALRR